MRKSQTSIKVLNNFKNKTVDLLKEFEMQGTISIGAKIYEFF